MERRVTGNCHARCEAGEKGKITSNPYLPLYEVRSFVGWFRHITLVLLVLAMLTVICAQQRLSCPAHESNQTSPFPIALTVPEVRRLLGRLLFPLSRSAPAVLAWSWWRRCQQARASASHAKRRLNSS